MRRLTSGFDPASCFGDTNLESAMVGTGWSLCLESALERLSRFTIASLVLCLLMCGALGITLGLFYEAALVLVHRCLSGVRASRAQCGCVPLGSTSVVEGLVWFSWQSLVFALLPPLHKGYFFSIYASETKKL